MGDSERERAGQRTRALNKMQNYYSDVLLKYLGDPGQHGLRDAHQVGEQAMQEGLGLPEMAEIHHEALIVMLGRRTGGEPPYLPEPESGAEPFPGSGGTILPLAADEGASLIKAAGAFFAASMLPYATGHSQCEEAIAGLRHINRRLEDQAARIAHAIYDEPMQLVAATHLVLNQMAAKDQSGNEKHFAAVADFLNQIEAQLSALSFELHPSVLDHVGLVAAADSLTGYFNRVAGTDMVLEASMRLPLSASLARVLYRAIHEALANIVTHAHARKAYVQLRQEGKSITCAIRDDGAGFDVSGGLAAGGERGLGLIGIRERVRAFGGSITVNSSPDNGTELIIVVPVKDEERIPRGDA
jgi:signal transduction histidine kinase